MKKKMLLFGFIVCIMMSCEKENTQEVGIASTRAISGQTVTGEKNPYVGELYYTYTVSLGNPTKNYSKLRITTLHNSALLRLNSGSHFDDYNLSFMMKAGTSKFTFDVYWTKEVTNEIIFITSDSDSPVQVETNISGINVKRQAITINAPKTINLGDKIELLAPYRLINSNHKAIWKYDTNIFSKELEDYSESNKQYRLVLKAKKGGVQSKISLDINELFLYSNWLNVRKGEHTVNIINPFKITLKNKYITQGDQFVAEMVDLNLASGATVKWYSAEGISLVSGQGTSKVTYEASNSLNGYSSIWANIADRGDTYLEKIDSIWIGKPVIVSNSNEYVMNVRNGVIISPKIDGAQSIDWSLESGNGNITILDNSKGIMVTSKASFDQSDEIVVALRASNSCGITTQRYKIKVLSVAQIGFSNIVRNSNDYIFSRIICNRNDISLELFLDWALVSDDSTIMFKIQDKIYTRNGAGSESIIVHLNEVNSFEIIYNEKDGLGNGGIYIVSVIGNALIEGTTGLVL